MVDYTRIIIYYIDENWLMFIFQDNPGEDRAVLLVTFHTPDGTKVTPQLFLSPRVEQ